MVQDANRTDLSPIGHPGTGAENDGAYTSPKPPADTLRTHASGTKMASEDALGATSTVPGYHPIPTLKMWAQVIGAEAEEYNQPFGSRDADWDDSITPQV